MFNSGKRTCKIYKPSSYVDEFNQDIVEYEDMGEAKIFIGINSRGTSPMSSVSVTQCNYVGVTTNLDIEVGWKVDDFEVVFITEGLRERYLYLKDYQYNEFRRIPARP